jgi:hypothetical protein
MGGITRWAGIVAAPLVKLSMVARGSFLDLGAARNLAQYSDGEHSVWLTDSAGKIAQANLDRPGTGETYTDLIGGTNPALRNGDMQVAEPPGSTWSRSANIIITGGVAVVTGVAGETCVQNVGGGAGALNKLSATFDLSTLRMYSGVSASVFPASGVFAYLTQVGANYIGFRSVTNGQTIDNVVYQQVLSPALTGAWAIRRRDGQATWEREDTGFSRNATSYRVEIAYQPRAAIMYSVPMPSAMRLTLMPRPYFTVTDFNQRFKGKEFPRQFKGAELPRFFTGKEFCRRITGTEMSR